MAISRRISVLYNPEFLSKTVKRNEAYMEHSEEFEWVKVRTYLTIVNGQYAFEILYKKVYH